MQYILLHKIKKKKTNEKPLTSCTCICCRWCILLSLSSTIFLCLCVSAWSSSRKSKKVFVLF